MTSPPTAVYVRELENFGTSGARPAWERQRAALDTDRLGLHASALPLGGDGEPGDLLDVLRDLQRDRQAPALGLRPPQPCADEGDHRQEASASKCPVNSKVAR